MPAVISTPPPSRFFSSSCSYWPRKRKPCERTVAFLSPIFSFIQALYRSLSFRHISHWLALSSNTDSLTIVMHFSTGQTASHAAAAARLHVGVVGAVGHDVEAGVGALNPAERALHARVEVDDGPHRPRRELLE